MRTVDHEADELVGVQRFGALPERVQDALGELAGAAKEGLLALSVGVGLGVLAELMEAEVDEVVGPKGKHDPDRVAVRHGHEAGSVTLGGRRVAVERPGMQAADGSGAGAGHVPALRRPRSAYRRSRGDSPAIGRSESDRGSPMPCAGGAEPKGG